MNPSGLKKPFLGPRQHKALRYYARRKTPPTCTELGKHLGITKVSAHLLVRKLRAQGLVERVGPGWRNTVITQSGLQQSMVTP